MNREGIELVFIGVLLDNGISDWDWDDTFAELEIDSLELVQMAMDIEDILSIDLEMRKLDTVKTPRDFVDMLVMYSEG